MRRREFLLGGLASVGALSTFPAASLQAFSPTPASERLVGVSYSIWFNSLPGLWRKAWGTPKYGIYNSADIDAIDRHIQELHAANVDFLLLDISNEIAIDWTSNVGDKGSLARRDITKILLERLLEFGKLKIVFLLGGNPPTVFDSGLLQKQIDRLYPLFFEPYNEVFLRYKGKPLLVVFLGPSATLQIGQPANTGMYIPSHWQGAYPAWKDDRFTTRFMGGFLTDQPRMMDGPISKYGYWSWEDRGTPSFSVKDGRVEAMTIIAANEASSLHPARPRNNGQTFIENWEYARKIGPKFALVTTFNEWIRSEQHDPEFSRDIEPSEEYGDTYLRILASQAALFKSGR
ncbi:hypothetical protein M2323_002084 [Rhodoblastus acidophilus]|uniref:hypothetical protein n=1 Tax=Rhodoblastus acidophilus TaxID=1074 RepID=UPI0022251D88|nr:hypothetical protein [Rhodoblastus acidophilus]MCW2284367.1 hypothetical protein [Rhodoblastus acidophilus]MCW2333155.1 hypothetical protein [Rhodoblastus acidophilus]